ncbi:sensor domain-containing protein [Nocardioides sp. zg-1228]|uniref:sensor domain-containing protein n=1 Tax=Nocardioides sp. zg-1228 TaxID=2763008 RepID=UPI0016428D94|nr:sensor domain-containing protein [Nocardioides sp. zg-1228]MBC2934629.1 sensor domain-containing protein [Nocardioides sp. zg-1228]QSF59376.1 sensor domain-containing protein [Nocardioides sp. zg-1228]
MRSVLVALAVLVTLLVPAPVVAAEEPPRPLQRRHLLTLDEYQAIYGYLLSSRVKVRRSPVLAPHRCVDRAAEVSGASRIQGSVYADERPPSVRDVEQTVVRFHSTREARALVDRYRTFSRRCVGESDVIIDGDQWHIEKRAWFPRTLGDESAGMLIVSTGPWEGESYFDRVLAVRVGRTVSVLDVRYWFAVPPRMELVVLGRRAVEHLR